MKFFTRWRIKNWHSQSNWDFGNAKWENHKNFNIFSWISFSLKAKIKSLMDGDHFAKSKTNNCYPNVSIKDNKWKTFSKCVWRKWVETNGVTVLIYFTKVKVKRSNSLCVSVWQTEKKKDEVQVIQAIFITYNIYTQLNLCLRLHLLYSHTQ